MDTPGQLRRPPAVRIDYTDYETAERAAIVRYAERKRVTYAEIARKWNIPETTFEHWRRNYRNGHILKGSVEVTISHKI